MGHILGLHHAVINYSSDPSILKSATLGQPYNGIDLLPEFPNCGDIEAAGRAVQFEGPPQADGGAAGCDVEAWSDNHNCCHPIELAFAPAVGHDNYKPASHIYSPPNNALYAAGSTIPIYLHQMDLDGSVYRVDWYSNGSPVATSYSPPFTLTASNVPAGTYNVQAVAYDTAQAYTASEVTTINVCGPPAPPTGLWGYASGGVVYIYWNAAFATGYQVEAGTAPGATNIGAWGTGATSFSGAVPPGTYYIRVRSNHNVCGLGPPTSDIAINVP